jgi:hypothetical protein
MGDLTDSIREPHVILAFFEGLRINSGEGLRFATTLRNP